MSDMQKIKEVIKDAQAVLITAGAGMGVDSGLPDFRGNKGFWKAYPPIAKLGLSFAQMANPQWFYDDPSLAWAFYGHRLNLYRETIPHDGFNMLLDLVRQKDENYFIFTSNVDGQFQKAGFDEEKICEVHGSIHYLQCAYNCNNEIWENDEEVVVDMECFKALKYPHCKYCEEVARPNILMFGDWGWKESRTSKQEYRYNKWKKANKDKKMVIIEIGAGTAIPTVRIEGELLSSRNPDATLIRINPREYKVEGKNEYSVPLGGLEGIKAVCVENV